MSSDMNASINAAKSSPNNELNANQKKLYESLQAEILSAGENIFKGMESASGSIFNKDWWYGQIMDWSMKNEQFKTQMFRFVDVLPYLTSSQDITKHLKEYFAQAGGDLPSIFNVGLGVSSFAPGILAGAVKKNVTQMAKMFITGETPEEALQGLKKSRKAGIAFTADLLGEATLSEKEALEYQNRYLNLISALAKDSKTWETQSQIDTDAFGPIPKVNVSVKMTSLYSQVIDRAWEETKSAILDRLRPIYRLAMQEGVFLNLDMEQYAYKDLTLEVFKTLVSENEFKNYPHWGIVIQAYLRDSYSDVQSLILWSKNRTAPFTVRLVKGAYWDSETIQSQQKGWPTPVFTNKKESDANFEACTHLLLENFKNVKLAMGSHNVRSIAAGIVMAKHLNVPNNAFEIQMLYGMGDPIKKSLVNQGFRVREYATIGELIPGMAYLVRRLLENTSNESFLRSKFAENIAPEVLLADPRENLKPTNPNPNLDSSIFSNEPPIDFAIEKNRMAMKSSLVQMRTQMGKDVLPQINGKTQKCQTVIERRNPSNSKELIARIHCADTALADMAVQVAKTASTGWKKVSFADRAKYLDQLADRMVALKFDLSAMQVLEVGKNWAESTADVDEAIDFCRYYAREARRLGQPKKVGNAPGEVSLYHYQPRGISLVIAPWNFPLAILTGMVAAAVVSGNTVIMKPAEQSSWIAQKLMQMCNDIKLPEGVVSFLPGLGEEIGAHLVAHPDIDLIAFTGSKAVGLSILREAGNTKPTQKQVKKCIIEMGGKNAVIIDSDADLDEAVQGVLYSAFGFSGQKCSACSRAIVHEAIYDRFLLRLEAAAESITVLPSENPRAYTGPVVDAEAQTRILAMIDRAKKESRLLFQGLAPNDGYFVPPTIFADVKPNSEIAQQEVFGPVLAVIKAEDMEEAIQIANNTEYALTGGIYSRSPANIEKAKLEFEVGNLYVNRGITGALVDRHPFGGFKMSGVGSKTGGPDYLLQFLEPRCVTENTMRRGFAPTNV